MLGDILSTNSKDVSSFEDLCSLLYIIIDSRKYLVGDMGCVCRMKDIMKKMCRFFLNANGDKRNCVFAMDH